MTARHLGTAMTALHLGTAMTVRHLGTGMTVRHPATATSAPGRLGKIVRRVKTEQPVRLPA